VRAHAGEQFDTWDERIITNPPAYGLSSSDARRRIMKTLLAGVNSIPKMSATPDGAAHEGLQSGNLRHIGMIVARPKGGQNHRQTASNHAKLQKIVFAQAAACRGDTYAEAFLGLKRSPHGTHSAESRPNIRSTLFWGEK
jgi:hypothetical protein